MLFCIRFIFIFINHIVTFSQKPCIDSLRKKIVDGARWTASRSRSSKRRGAAGRLPPLPDRFAQNIIPTMSKLSHLHQNYHTQFSSYNFVDFTYIGLFVYVNMNKHRRQTTNQSYFPQNYIYFQRAEYPELLRIYQSTCLPNCMLLYTSDMSIYAAEIMYSTHTQ